MEVFLLLLLLLLLFCVVSSESATNMVDQIRRSPGLGRRKFSTCVDLRFVSSPTCVGLHRLTDQ